MEKKLQEKLQRQREKTERQKERQSVAAAAAAADSGLVGVSIPAAPVGPVKKVKVKALRLKKGMKVRVSRGVTAQTRAGTAGCVGTKGADTAGNNKKSC